MEMCHSNTHLSLYGMGDAPTLVAKRRCAPNNACPPFVTKVGTSQILNKLKYVGKQNVSFLPSTEPSARLGDIGTSHFIRLGTIAFRRISDLCLLFEFVT
jgi:hypothetical protein